MAGRTLRLVRRVTATVGGWAGDGTVWQGDLPANAPKPATVNAVEDPLGGPVFNIHLRPSYAGATSRSRGCLGILRVVGADSSRRFDMRIVAGWEKETPGSPVMNSSEAAIMDWQQPAGASPPTPPDARDIGDGEDFTTYPLDFSYQSIAFHLVPQGGSLAAGSSVELWAVEF